ncbi:hypothetical protein Syun_015757 [Stephania yunnanensis]|uniref:Uncharacterized protein n=1 Tax=Stephania yunnanensis TaxID=152371 RepID=A0AAP0JP56_9MAGN
MNISTTTTTTMAARASGCTCTSTRLLVRSGFSCSSKSLFVWSKFGGTNGEGRRGCVGKVVKRLRVVNAVVTAAASEGVVVTSTQPEAKRSISEGVAKELGVLVSRVANAALTVIRPKLKRKNNKSSSSWKRQAEMLIEIGVVDCRFFTLFAVAGSLLGSILCFFEGCVLILESYCEYFRAMSQRSVEEGHVMHLLIEAIDMFLMGSALLIFGMGLYSLFVNQKTMNAEDRKGLCPRSNLFGLFHLKTLPTWLEMQCISQAKSKIGHAVLMILQVGVLDKFKNVPLVTGLDLACFAGAVLISSACTFLLSKLAVDRTQCGR